MRIGIYASMLASEIGHEHNVSGHIQVPAHSARLLHQAGHEVHLITNEFGPQHTFPAMMPRDLHTHFVTDARVRPEKMRGARSTDGVRPGALLRQVAQIRRIVRRQRLDVLHLFGFMRTAQLGGALAASAMRTPVVATVLNGEVSRSGGRAGRWLLRRLGAVCSATAYVARRYESLGLAVKQIRHGVIRDLRTEEGFSAAAPRNRVLFWRDANEMNGGDLSLAAFDALAPRFPQFTFTMAIRPAWNEVPGIDELPRRHPNVHIHRFPYEPGMSLARLMSESLLVVLPFRKLSVEPQFAIAESLASGVAVVASDVQSNPELIESGITGDTAPAGDAEALTRAIERLLSHPERLAAMGKAAAERFAQQWNWSNYVSELEALYGRIIRH